MSKKPGRKRDGKEVKKIAQVRIEPKVLKEIIEKYGSFTTFVNAKIKGEF